ncbi:AraC family transcriptional regulator [Chitinophaga qingshengii]|uniref:Helix-turn-helix transcriptional regulator n=1 Tax=Chitinophaga qingshengii TaxID=1569794 RepID=A0ABR7TTG0_9BACT|nr:AraC family transcriptional regulator [Chitinophaga qingshengii]MBC9932699.1 helix-turn-helix transcriptional regulator [Chitinophaga qingshengii]
MSIKNCTLSIFHFSRFTGMRNEQTSPDFILLNIGHAVHNADWNWRKVCSPFIRVHFIESGTARLIREDKVYELKKNHLYLTPAYTSHGYKCEGHLSLYYIHIYEEQHHHTSCFDLIDVPVEIKADPLVIQLVKRLADIHPERKLPHFDPWSYDNFPTLIRNIARQNTTPLGYEMEAQGIIRQIISRFLVHATHKNRHIDKRILQALRYIHSHLHKPVSVDMLAENSFLTKDHFIRLFKKYMGCTPGKYINGKKIEKAQRIMMTRDVAIKDLAYSLGFENDAYFNRFFKRETGENPGNYKKKIRLLAGGDFT